MSPPKTLSKIRSHDRRSSRSNVRTAPLFSGKVLNAALCVMLVAGTVALYSPVFGHSFVVYDDSDYVTGNLHVRDGLSWSTVKWAFTTTDAANWHPLTWLSHALDCEIFGLNPGGHHLDNVLIHALNAALLYLLLAWSTRRTWPSLLVAALFAIHPINVESVAWVAERKNVLSTLFFLLAIAAYVFYAKRPGWRRYVLVASLFAAGLMAKPLVITLPFVLLLLDYWPLERISPSKTNPDTMRTAVPRVTVTRLLLEKIPLLLLSAASALITLRAQRQAIGSLQRFPLALRIENAIVSYVLYLWKVLWPARLAVLYPHPAFALPAWRWFLSAAVLLLISTLVVVFRERRYLPVGWFWFLGTLVPVIGLVQVGNAAMSDRYAYIPLIGILLMIAWCADDVATAKQVHLLWLLVPALLVLPALGIATHRQISYWDSDYDLWSHALSVTEENPVAHGAVAGALLHPEQGMSQADLEEQDTNTEEKRLQLARMHHEQALQIYRELAERNPEIYRGYVAMLLKDLGNLDRYQGRLNEARHEYEEALEIYHQQQEPKSDSDLYGQVALLDEFGTLDRMQNRWDEQRLHYEEDLYLYKQLALQKPNTYLPFLAKTLNNLGTLDLRQGRLDECRDHYGEALRIYRQLAQQDSAKYLRDVAGTLTYLGFVTRKQNQLQESRSFYQEALVLYRKLLERDKEYAGTITGIEGILQEIGVSQPASAQ